MELMEGVKGYSDSREEDEEKEEGAEEEIITSSSSKHNFPSFSLSSPSSSSIVTNYTRHHHNHHHHVIINPHQQNPWLGMMHIHDHHHHRSPEATESHNSSSELGLLHHYQDAAPSNFIINNSNHTTKQLDFMDLSLGSTNKDEPNFQGSGGGASASAIYTHHHGNNVGPSSSSGNSNHQQHQQVAEKEHMFDKVVTPSDVGKLNRLVIPKQHAEKYFPLDSTSNEKGLLLNFEDRNGKLWRFRYSYWNSSQSYVMTKGWSRFVKEKKLDAGDIVSFQRGVGELYRQRLYIDWRRRPDHHHHQHQYHHSDPSSTLFTPFFLPNHPQFFSVRWGATATASGRFYSLPSPTPLTPPRHHHDINYNNSMYHQQHPFHHGNVTHHHHYNNNYNEMSSTSTTSGSGSVYYLRSTTQIPMPLVDHQSLSTRQQQQQEGGGGNVSLSPMIIDSVPVAHHHHQQHHHNQQHHGGSSNSSSAGKRLRLFGVNMECASSTSEDPKCFDSNSLPSSSLPPLQLLREHTLPSPTSSTMFGDQRGEASMDPSNLQYRQ